MANVQYDQGVPFAEPAATPPEDYQRIEANPSEFGGLIAQGEAKAGEGAITAAKFYSQIAAQQAVANWQQTANQSLSDFKKLKGQDAMTAQPDVLHGLTDAEKEGAASLPNADAQLNFTQSIHFLRARYEAEIGNHYDQQSQVWGVGVNETAASLAMQDIETGTVTGNAAQVAEGTSNLAGARVKQAQLLYGKTLTPDMLQSRQQAAYAEAVETQVRALTPTNPARAAALLDANKDKLPALAYDVLSRQTKAMSEDAAVAQSAASVPLSGRTLDVVPGAPIQLDIGTRARAQDVHDAAVRQGAPDDEAWGWAANAVHESGANTAPRPGDGGISHGMFQLNKDQLAQYQASHNGHLPEQDSLDTQLQFARSQAAPMLVGATGPDGYAAAISTGFEAPANGKQEASSRAATALALSGRGAQQQAIVPGAPTSQHVPQAYDWEAQIMNATRQTAARNFPDRPDLQRRVIDIKWQEIQQNNLMQAKREAEQQKAQKDAQDKILNDAITVLNGDPTKFNPSMLDAKDASGAYILLPAQREGLTEFAKRQLSQHGVEDITQFGPGWTKAYNDMLAPPGTPGRINDLSDIVRRAGPNGDLTSAGVSLLTKYFAMSRKSPDEREVVSTAGGLMAEAKRQLLFPNAVDSSMATPYSLRDPRGEAIYNTKFLPRFNKGLSDAESSGDPQKVWDFLTPENLAKIVNPIKRNPQQLADDRLSETGGNEPGAPPHPDATPIPAAPDGLNATEWSHIMTAPPLAQNGQAYTHAAWGQVLQKLASDPAKVAPWFNYYFGAAGYDGAEIAQRLNSKEPTVPDVFAPGGGAIMGPQP